MLDLDALKQEIATEATRAISRAWHTEALLIAERVEGWERRWGVLLDALEQIGWPKEGGEGDG